MQSNERPCGFVDLTAVAHPNSENYLNITQEFDFCRLCFMFIVCHWVIDFLNLLIDPPD